MEGKHRALYRKGHATMLVKRSGIEVLIVSTLCAIGSIRFLLGVEFGPLPTMNNSETAHQATLGAFDDPFFN